MIHIIDHLMLFHSSCMLCSAFLLSFFPFIFQFHNSYYPIFTYTDSSFMLSLLMSFLKAFSTYFINIFIFNISFWLFWCPPHCWNAICSRVLSTFSTRAFNLISHQSVQFSSVAQSCPTLCNPMDSSTSGFPIHHQLPELAQTHIHWVGGAIQPSRPLSAPSPPSVPSFPASGSCVAFQMCVSEHIHI